MLFTPVKGITPVIAIILLLLMAVAAAGGFYFVYQGFTESGQESGETQIEQLGEQSLAQIQIESAAGGRIYVRNVGASDIDLSKSTVYVEDRPVDVSRSSETLAQKNRAVLKLTEAPGCTKERCEVKISGTASTSKSIDLSRLVCSSDADCYSGEACEGGVCVEGEPPACGDGECGSGEDGMSCFADCGPRHFAGFDLDPAEGDFDVYSYGWSGTTYVKGENLTSSLIGEVIRTSTIDSQGNLLVIGGIPFAMGGPNPPPEVFWLYNSSGTWTALDNITDNDWEDSIGGHGCDFNSSNEAIAVWTRGGSPHVVAWSSFDGTGWSESQNLTETAGNEPYIYEYPAFSFADDDKGMLVWAPSSDGTPWINCSLWDDGWGQFESIQELPETSSWEIRGLDVEFNSTHAIAAWTVQHGGIGSDFDEMVQWSTWDGTGWSEPENLTDEMGCYYANETYEGGDIELVVDNDDNLMMMTQNRSSSPSWVEWWSWDGGWVYEGNFTTGATCSGVGVVENEKNAITGLCAVFSASVEYYYTYWDGTEWSELSAFG